MSIQLKVKIKSLAAESKIIRHEELLAKRYRNNKLREDLYFHRIWDVRRASRTAQIAYGFLRGRKYLEIEQCDQDNLPDGMEVMKLIRKFGPGKVAKENVDAWFNGDLGRLHNRKVYVG